MKTILRISLILAVLIAGGCKRQKVDYLGPAYISAPKGFSVTGFTATPMSVDFTATDVDFSATFSHTVTWMLTMEGQESGATYKMKGTANSLAGVSWTGLHDDLTFFRTNEDVLVTLSFYGTQQTYSLTVHIIKEPDFTCGLFANYGDFENAAMITPGNAWYGFGAAGASSGVDSMATDYNGNLVPSVQGRNYYYVKGIGTASLGFVNGFQYGGVMTPVMPADANNVWVNMFVYGTGDANAGIEIEYQEEDFDGTQFGYTGADDDAMVAKITLSHTGWKLFSFRYSDLVPSLNAEFGGSGNKKHEPDRLRGFVVVLIKRTDVTSPVEVYVDYPIITVGGPFNQCQ